MFDDLVQDLKGGSEDEQITAVRALGSLGDRRAGPILLQVLDTAGSYRVRNAVALALAELRDTSAVPALRRQLWLPENATNRGN